jgi:hypothetical protein
MTKAWPFVVAAVCALVAGLWVHRVDADKAAEVQIVRLTHTVHQKDSVFVHDTLVFTRTIKVPIALHDTVVKHLSDTVLVARYIAASDSALKACTDVFQSCKASIAARDSLIAAYKSLKPSRIGLGLIAGCGVGFDGKPASVIGGGVSYKVW